MKEYFFYGWERANVSPINENFFGIKDPRDLYDALSELWCVDTCAPRLRSEWTIDNPTLGQCSITAFLAQDIFGGEVYGIERNDGNFHCYNVVGDIVFDLTSEQFKGEQLPYEGNPKQLREVHFAKEEKKLRYELLRSLLFKRQDRLEDRTLSWEETKCEHLIKDRWIDLRRSTYRFPDGSEFSPFYSYSRRDYVVIVATDTEENYICVRQYRQGIGRVTTEFCAGGIERNDGNEYRQTGIDPDKEKEVFENALSAAKRELLEETGYGSDEWEQLLSIPSNATIADNYAYIFSAKNCKRVSSQHLDSTEFLKVKLLSKTDIRERIKNGDFLQAVHVMAFLLERKEDND